MKQTGVVIGLEGDKAKIRVQRHTACGDCGACHVSKSQMQMIFEAENNVGAKVGDFVEIDMESMDFLSAVIIAYLYPMISLIAGIFAGYLGTKALGFGEFAAQGIGAVSGILAATLTYLVIRLRENKINNMKKYKPIITNIVNEDK